VLGTLRRALLGIVASRSIEELGRSVCDGVALQSTVLARLWSNDRDSAVLRLLASAGHPVSGGSYDRIDGAFATVPYGAGKIGRIAATRESMIVPQLRGDEDWLANPAWVARQGVRSFVGFPLIAEGEVLGVLAAFSRTPAADDSVDDLRFAADVAAVRLRALEQASERPTPLVATPRAAAILTRADLRVLERQSIQAALVECHGKVFGGDGAAALVATKPTTLLSRMKALGIRHVPADKAPPEKG
jgi:GAF domain-containing protein